MEKDNQLDKRENNFENRLVEKIKLDNLTPKPRWQFLLKDYAIWLSGALSLLMGAAAVAVMIYLVQYNDWDLIAHTRQSFAEYVLLTLPYFWLAFLALFIFILNYNLRHTGRTYRYPWTVIAGVSALASLLLGSLLYAAGWGSKIDDVLGAKLPIYDQVINRHVIYWNHPEEGRLAGVVAEIFENGEIAIIAPDGRRWQVTATSGPLSGHNFKAGDPIRVIGQEFEKGYFRVQIMKPVRPGRAFMMSHPAGPGRNHPMRPLPPSLPSF